MWLSRLLTRVSVGLAGGALGDALAERGRCGKDRQVLLDDLLDIIFDLGLDNEQIGGLPEASGSGGPA